MVRGREMALCVGKVGGFFFEKAGEGKSDHSGTIHILGQWAGLKTCKGGNGTC